MTAFKERISAMVMTTSSRDKLWRLLWVIAWTEAVLSLSLVVLVSKPLTNLISLLPALEMDVVIPNILQVVIGLTVTTVSIHGLLISQAKLRNPYMYETTKAHRVWFVTGIILVVLLTVSIVFVPSAVESESGELVEILRFGMKSYLKDAAWKVSIDRIQQEYQCCGVLSSNDWMETQWIPPESLSLEVLNLEGVVQEDGVFRVRLVPASCCNPDVREPCFHDFLQQNSTSSRPLDPDTIYSRGCASILTNPIVLLVGSFKAVITLSLLLQIGQLIIGKFLHLTVKHVKASVFEDKVYDEVESKENTILRADNSTICQMKSHESEFETFNLTTLESQSESDIENRESETDSESVAEVEESGPSEDEVPPELKPKLMASLRQKLKKSVFHQNPAERRKLDKSSIPLSNKRSRTNMRPARAMPPVLPLRQDRVVLRTSKNTKSSNMSSVPEESEYTGKTRGTHPEDLDLLQPINLISFNN